MDALLVEFEVVEVVHLEALKWTYIIYFDGFLNTPPLAAQLSLIDGINVEVGDDGWSVQFLLGWGDCASGCLYGDHWEVWVPDGDGEAVLLDELGHDIGWWKDAASCI